MMREYLIRLPWPPAKLSANGSQGDWRGKASKAKKYKAECAKQCGVQRIQKLDAPEVSVSVTFHPPRNGRFDLDNALKKAKQGLDAVAEAIGVDDADWVSMTLNRGDKVQGGAVMVHVHPPRVTASIPLVGEIG